MKKIILQDQRMVSDELQAATSFNASLSTGLSQLADRKRTRRDFLKKAALTGGAACLMPQALFSPKEAQASLLVLGRLFWIFVGAFVAAVATEAAAMVVNRRGQVSYEGVQIRCPRCGRVVRVDNAYVGRSTLIHRHSISCPISGSHGRLGLDAQAVSNLGGSSGRQIQNIKRGHGSALNDDIFDAWKDQGVNVYEYRPRDNQWSMQADRYPDAYGDVGLRFNMRSGKVGRAASCRGVSSYREPISVSVFHPYGNRVYCFTELINARGSYVKHIWINRLNYYDELVNVDYVSSNRYRTWSYKENNPFPGSWAVAVVIDNRETHQMVGFQWR